MAAVIVHEEEKVAKVFETMTNIQDVQAFRDRFKAMYPEDWKRIIAKFNKEERDTKPGKTHPMQ